ncbi:MAG TPA: hypothetical protein VME18_09950 [Acidobacteriaceae bacterium]|nr:hypothetical protein [Acidobacteriaceae bacterium]
MKTGIHPRPELRILAAPSVLSGKGGKAMEGYWLAHYDSGSRRGEGIVMLRGGDLLGGDLEHVWTGTYEEESPKLYARIRIVPFVSCAEERSMAREQPVILSLSGFCTNEYATLEGYPEGYDGEPFHVEMRRCRSMRAQTEPERKAA